MSKLSAIDESWGRVSPKVAKANGIKVVYGYLSNDRSKNLTSAEIKAYHKYGIGVWLGWESLTNRPLSGAGAGKQDAHSAKLQLFAHYKNVGYRPSNKVSIPFSCDFDISSRQLPTALKYYQAAQHELGDNIYAGAYGEYDLIQYLYKHGFHYGLFQAYAWSYGKKSPHADLYQYQNGMTLGGASVDFDELINAAQLGAWWPPDHPLNTGEDEVTKDDINAIVEAVWTAKLTNSHMGPDANQKVTAQASTWLTQSERYSSANNRALAALDPDKLLAAISKQGVSVTKQQIEAALTEVLNDTKIVAG